MYGLRFGTVVTLVQGRLQDCDIVQATVSFELLTMIGYLKHAWGGCGDLVMNQGPGRLSP